ncbi:glycosyltransferase family 2 protein [Parasphingorhabdus sp.]|uniref:glycosyltransferase family 2 protein n=1 Tax=Parasphingorhabdus sp. TaxID=2709688 RepID=UPI003266E547
MTAAQAGMTIASWALALPLTALFAIFSIEIIAGLKKSRSVSDENDNAGNSPSRATILVPAHNEAGIIGTTISALRSRIADGIDILVVADNCTDDTASLARAAGADVAERHDGSLRGKAYALAYGRDRLADDPPQCVIVMDADCMLEPGSAELLCETAMQADAPVQATNLIRGDKAAPPMVQISNFAMLVKNLVRQRGMTRMGGAALLTGTGMAFPWKIFGEAPLANADLAEDLALGVTLTRSGSVPLFVEAAQVSSDAAAHEDTLVQRTRWEHGFVATARRYALPLISSGLGKLSGSQIFLGLHLLVPPLALLFALGGITLAAILLLGAGGAGYGPVVVLGLIMSLAVIVTLLAWISYGRTVLTPGSLIRIPFYILWKIPVYLKLVGNRETRWIRTRRDGEEAPDP